MIDRVNQQAERDGDLSNVPINALTHLTTPVPPVDPSPIYETSYTDWLRLSRSQQQFIFKDQNILLHNCPVATRNFNLAAFRDLLGGVDTERIMHGLYLAGFYFLLFHIFLMLNFKISHVQKTQSLMLRMNQRQRKTLIYLIKVF